jgi:hypothetical protein
MDQGFNVIEDQELEENGLNTCEEISIIQMFRNTKREEFESYQDYCVKGLETLVGEVENYGKFSEYLNNLLDEQVPYLVRTANTFQIEINKDKASLQEWDQPNIVPKNNEDKYSLFKIFNHIEMEDDNPNWYHSQLNINS